MKQFAPSFKNLLLLSAVASFAFLMSCGNDDDTDPGPQLTGNEIEFPLSAVGSSGASGTATFEELDDNSTRVTISLSGAAAGSDHPAHIHSNNAAEGGGIAIDLNNVVAGNSVTTVGQTNDGTAITYDELIAYDGYINVHNSTSDLGTLIVQGDIGQNVLTGESVDYDLNAVSNEAISGTVTFHERESGETLIVIELTGTSDEGDHPAHIHQNDAATGGGIVIGLSNVNGSTGISRTNVGAFNDGTAVTYADLIDYNGYVNVHNSASDLGTLIAQGNIGSNAN